MALHVNSEHERRDIPRADTFDFHESPDNAVAVLLSVDGDTLRCFEAIWEMAAGRGALVKPLRRAGRCVSGLSSARSRNRFSGGPEQ